MPDDSASLVRQLDELNRIGAALSAERDTGKLLDLILAKARAITSSDAGSLYLVGPKDGADPNDDEAPRVLRFAVAQNDSVDLPFRFSALEITDRSIAGYVALTGGTVRLDDAYVPPAGVPYTFNHAFDDAAGYRTQSVLAVPMRTPKGHIVGVVQLINATTDGAVTTYTGRDEALALSLASQAAVAVENSQLYAAIQRLFEGFVRASVVAIEARDPATSGHSFRVANLTVAFAETVDRADGGAFASVRFSREEMRTLRYASLLHDFGKVGVREDVLVKAKKLYPAQRELVRERFKLARRTRELESSAAPPRLPPRARPRRLHRPPAHPRGGTPRGGRLPRAGARRRRGRQRAERAAGRQLRWAARDRGRHLRRRRRGDATAADAGRGAVASLRKGSLSEAERLQIESHVLHSYRFLGQIPWTREIRRIPAIAVGHHEKLDGTGYPNRLSGATSRSRPG